MSNQMNLKAYRSWEPHDEINLYSTLEGYLTKGSLVQPVPGTAVNDNQNGFGLPFANVPGYAVSAAYVVNWKVTAATSGSQTAFGILLYDVVTNLTDPWLQAAIFVDPAKLAEKQVVASGRAVPFATKGIFEVTGIDTTAGYPDNGTGAYVSNSGLGLIATGPSKTTLDGTDRKSVQ